MSTLLAAPRGAAVARISNLRVERSDIEFGAAAPGRLRIGVTVHNDGDAPSRPTKMRLESAVLGAFVPWAPLTEMFAPSIPPGESVTVETEVDQPPMAPTTLGSAPPLRRILTAIASGDRHRRSRDRDTYWAGNINVHIGKRSVERHRAMSLRIMPGKSNMALFFVGEWRSDEEYALRVECDREDWQFGIFDAPWRVILPWKSDDFNAIEYGARLSIRGGRSVVLLMHVPLDCTTGSVAVHVEELSTGKDAIVEFSFDAEADGPGCYTL